MILMVSPSRWTAVFLARIVIPFSRSRSPESSTRSATCAFARNAPDCQSIASTSVVLPWSTCATIAMFRRSSRVAPAVDGTAGVEGDAGMVNGLRWRSWGLPPNHAACPVYSHPYPERLPLPAPPTDAPQARGGPPAPASRCPLSAAAPAPLLRPRLGIPNPKSQPPTPNPQPPTPNPQTSNRTYIRKRASLG